MKSTSLKTSAALLLAALIAAPGFPSWGGVGFTD